MLKKTVLTAAAALTMFAGATALQADPAEAGVKIQLVHGKGHGFAHGKAPFGGKRHFHGPRFGFYPGRPFCFTRYKTVRVKRWSPRRHRWVTRKITRPVTICR